MKRFCTALLLLAMLLSAAPHRGATGGLPSPLGEVGSGPVEMGKTYRIESVATGQALLTQNSSLDGNMDVLLWPDTDVPSQQWTLVGNATHAIVRNAYSGCALGVLQTAKGSRAKQLNPGTTFLWQLIAADGAANTYRLRTGNLFLAVSEADSSAPVLAANDAASTAQQWRLVQVEPHATFTPAMRQQMIDDYISATVETKGNSRSTFVGGGWGESEQLEVVLDAYETTGRPEYLQLAKNVYGWFGQNVGPSWNHLVYTDSYHWFGHDFNDDVMWQIIATARLGLLAADQRYIDQAKRNFDIIYERAYIPFTGLMRWAENTGDPFSTNSCIAGPAEVAACYLGFAGCGEEYFERARELYAAQRYVLANNMNSGKVDDSVVWDPETRQVKSRNSWASTYNQGTMLGAACMLYKYYADKQYLTDARTIMAWTRANMCDSHGIINVCQVQDGDLAGFKGILMRYVRRFVRDIGRPDYAPWLAQNAMHAFCNRSTKGVTPTAWLQKGTDANTTDDFGLSTAASAAANVSFDTDPPLPYTETPRVPDAIRGTQPDGTPHKAAGSDTHVYHLSGQAASLPLHRGVYLTGRHKVFIR